jgi:4-alpha-glucanotransferase
MNWAMIRAAVNSVASLCVVPLQDVLGLGSETRMNVPSQEAGNWRWRFQADMLRPELGQKLADMAELADRLPPPVAPPNNEEWTA